jgi:hypothetical protein
VAAGVSIIKGVGIDVQATRKRMMKRPMRFTKSVYPVLEVSV